MTDETLNHQDTAAIEMIDVQLRHPEIVSPWRVNGVNWRIGTRDFWAVGGLHWSGKSNLLTTAAAVHARMRCSLRIFGRELSDLTAEEALETRLRIGMVFEGTGRLFPNMTVVENIALPLRYRLESDEDEIWDVIGETLELLDLADAAEALAGEIDFGLKRRAALARAAVMRPEVLMLDQPLVGLDPRQRVWWAELLERIHRGHPLFGNKPVATVVATEDLRPWLRRATRFAVIGEGGFDAVGDQKALLESRNPLVEELMDVNVERN